MAAEKKKAKVVDKWKRKSWYSVLAPEMFEGKEIGQIIASDEKTLQNRVLRIGLAELTGTLGQASAYTTLNFRVSEVKGKTAYTKLIGHELSRAYIKTLVRRRRSKVSDVVDVTTKDGVNLRVKAVVLTASKASGNVKTALRHAVAEETIRLAKEMDFPVLAQEIIFGKFGVRIFNRIKKIAPIRRVEIRKTEVKEKFT